MPGDFAQVVRHLDRRHETVVEEDVFEPDSCGRYRLGEGRRVGTPRTAVAEPAGELPVGRNVFPVPFLGGGCRRRFRAGLRVGSAPARARCGDPRHAVRPDRDAIAFGGCGLLDVVENPGDGLGLRHVEVFVRAQFRFAALSVVVVQLTERTFRRARL